MFKPVFPYKDNQLILTSDRVTIHSKSDAIFLFGKQAVSLSSTKTINLDANEGIKLYSNIVELGPNAKTDGEPLLLAKTFNRQLLTLLEELAAVGTLLGQASESDLGATMQYIASAGKKINSEATRLGDIIRDPNSIVLSKNTFTR
jgi:hypothetical protein